MFMNYNNNSNTSCNKNIAFTKQNEQNMSLETRKYLNFKIKNNKKAVM